MEKVNIRSLASYTHMLMDKIHEEVPSLIAFLTEKRHGQQGASNMPKTTNFSYEAPQYILHTAGTQKFAFSIVYYAKFDHCASIRALALRER